MSKTNKEKETISKEKKLKVIIDEKRGISKAARQEKRPGKLN
jgi:hypothetical protein